MNWNWIRRALLASCLLVSTSARADDKPAPSDGPSEDSPRSRLSIAGRYSTDGYSQSKFYLGSGGQIESGASNELDNFWAQDLTLQPRLIVSDNVNISASMRIASGIWGFDDQGMYDYPDDGPGPFYINRNTLQLVQFDWLYLAYRHAGTATRWYIGRQEFSLGNKLVLDHDSPGIQVLRDFSNWGGHLGLGYAKAFEAAGFSDEDNVDRTEDRSGPDSRDADIFYAEWKSQNERFQFNPFYIYYVDRSTSNGSSLVPNHLPYLDARFRPNVTRLNALGVAFKLKLANILFDFEADQLKGVDRIKNSDSGLYEMHDLNNGDINGSNLFMKVTFFTRRVDLGGVFAQGSGDEDVTTGEGNVNRIRTDGSFFITEVWDDSIMPRRGIAPDGLGSPYIRGYRELENTKIMQGFADIRVTSTVKLYTSFSWIRASQPIRTWSDQNSDGVITPDEFGSLLSASTELGSEFDWRLDWQIDKRVLLVYRGGRFLPRAAAGHLINGTPEYSEAATEHRITISVDIPEFSLGG